MKKRLGLWWLSLLACCCLMTACRPAVLVYEIAESNVAVPHVDVWDYIMNQLMGWNFIVWLIIDAFAVYFIVSHGYKWLEWLRRQPLTAKVLALYVLLGILFVTGCLSLKEIGQSHGGWFAFPLTIMISSFCLVCRSIGRRFRYKMDSDESPAIYKWQRNLYWLAIIMLWVWSCGWVLHFVAIGIDGKSHVGADLFFRSAICSFQLFVMNFDGNLLDALQEHDVLRGMIVCVGVTAALCMATLIVSLVISRLMAYLHVKHLNIDAQHNHLYVFFGMGDASMRLAEDICGNSGDSKAVILFVEKSLANEREKDDENDTDGWKNIKSIFTHRRKIFHDAHEDEKHALAIANCGICSLDAETTDVWGHIGLSDVKRQIGKSGPLGQIQGAELHIFFLSEDRDINVRAASKMAQDTTISQVPYKTRIYCHARRNGVNKVIESKGTKVEVKILDSSHLSLEHLKRDVKNHPVNFVDVKTLKDENPGTVSDTFTSLVVGFGETGQEAVKFLYEFGAFVSDKSSENDSFRSPFVCHVVDNNMDKLEGEFIASVPGVRCKQSMYVIPYFFKNSSSPIRFHKCDYRSSEFYENILEPIAKDLNYVVVTLGDDETSITVAVEILRFVRRVREDLTKFRIYVRAYEKGTFKHLEDIAKHYNEWLRSPKDETDKIVLFGQSQLIYTYKLVVNDQYEEDGKNYYEMYRSLNIDPANDEGLWDERRKNTLSPQKGGTLWEKMSKIRRKESQDRSNALHADTKIMILEKAIGVDHVKDFAQRALAQRTGKQKNITYPNLSPEENKLMLNLAMCEHLRWNAAHEMLGYVNEPIGHECNERMKRHNCLKPWQELDNESNNAGYPVDFKIFDFGVVETSLKMKYGEV